MNGAQGRDRTTDTAIFSRMLYQLSYLGRCRAEDPSAPVYSGAEAPCPPVSGALWMPQREIAPVRVRKPAQRLI